MDAFTGRLIISVCFSANSKRLNGATVATQDPLNNDNNDRQIARAILVRDQAIGMMLLKCEAHVSACPQIKRFVGRI